METGLENQRSVAFSCPLNAWGRSKLWSALLCQHRGFLSPECVFITGLVFCLAGAMNDPATMELHFNPIMKAAGITPCLSQVL
jgi:hypothetical protein